VRNLPDMRRAIWTVLPHSPNRYFEVSHLGTEIIEVNVNARIRQEKLQIIKLSLTMRYFFEKKIHLKVIRNTHTQNGTITQVIILAALDDFATIGSIRKALPTS
jgi:hypothetical protein